MKPTSAMVFAVLTLTSLLESHPCTAQDSGTKLPSKDEISKLVSDAATTSQTDPTWADQVVAGHRSVLTIYLTTEAMDVDVQIVSNLAEINDTEKQVGAPATSSGSTTVAEKSGFAKLLGLAIERGAIAQEKSGSTTTLSTSPYMLAALKHGDTADNYRKFWLMRALGLAASFKVEDSGSDDIDFDTLESWSAKVQLGDRTARSPEFMADWRKEIAPIYIRHSVCLHDGLQPTMLDEELIPLLERTAAVWKLVATALRQQLQGRKPAPLNATEQTALESQIATIFTDEVQTPIRNGNLGSAELRATLQGKFARCLRQSASDLATVNDKLRELLDRAKAQPIFTIGYTQNLVDDGSDFSDIKLLLDTRIPVEQLLAPDLMVDGRISLFHQAHDDDHDVIRSYALSLALEWSFDNVVAAFVQPNQPFTSPITLALSGRFERLETAKDEAGVVQAKVEIPITPGVSFPIAVTYASRTELVNESEVHGNFGFSLDWEKLLALRNVMAVAAAPPPTP